MFDHFKWPCSPLLLPPLSPALYPLGISVTCLISGSPGAINAQAASWILPGAFPPGQKDCLGPLPHCLSPIQSLFSLAVPVPRGGKVNGSQNVKFKLE